MTNSDLIMEMTGESRDTQVQPSVFAWTGYFYIDLDQPLPDLTLTNGRASGSPPVTFPVVRHDHNWTVEIPGSEQPRPAIIRFRRTGPLSYTYWIWGPADPEYGHYDFILSEHPNPHYHHGRRWLII